MNEYDFDELANKFLNNEESELTESVADDEPPLLPGDVQDAKASTGFQKKDVFDTVQVLLQSLVIVALLFMFVFRIATVSGNSMNPTLNSSDALVITNTDFKYDRGDIVIISQPNMLDEVLIKRVVALAGETIDINTDGHVTINGAVLKEEYISEAIIDRGDIYFPHTVADGMVFVMGDNRNGSTDSRWGGVGDIDTRYIVGKTKVRLLPFNEIKTFGDINYSMSSGESNE